MKSFKKLFASQGSSEATDASSQSSSPKQPLSEPALAPGVYGNFPTSFSIYFAGRSDNGKSDFFFLASDSNGQITPLYAFSTHKGMVKHQITLYSGPSHSSTPLALAGIEKFLRSVSVVALPAPTAGPEGPSNQIERLKMLSSMKFESASFSVVVGVLGNNNQSIETFEWRSDNVLKPRTDQPFERTLVRLSNSATRDEEVVGAWIEEAVPERESKLGTFHFQGSGTTGELGRYWTLMAVTSLLRMNQVRWEASVAADKMIKASGKLTIAGIGMV